MATLKRHDYTTWRDRSLEVRIERLQERIRHLYGMASPEEQWDLYEQEDSEVNQLHDEIVRIQNELYSRERSAPQ